ncbi:MAG: A24 family peptidase [Pirellulaceae bacterium]|nr:A24 family peptidase [Pirellulaceae bacterium]
MEFFFAQVMENWHIWFVTLALVVAAIIDGIQLKVPNWLTFPFIMSGWAYSMFAFGLAGDGWLTGLGVSLLGTFVGLALLMPAYAIGGMGAGDVKLLAGVGAWVHVQSTFYGFCLSAIVGAILAVAMVLISRSWTKHKSQFFSILNEIMVIRNPETLASIAAKRKSRMMLLPYGIPIAIGCIMYFAWAGLLVDTTNTAM